MNVTTQSMSFDDEEKHMRELLKEAGDGGVAPTAEHLERVRKAIASRLGPVRMDTVRPGTVRMDTVRPAPASLSRRTWLKYTVGGLAAASAAVAVTSLLRPTDLWAQVVKAMEARPWIHAAGKMNGESQEFWISIPRRVHAAHWGRSALYSDYRTGVEDSYIADQNLLVRTALTDNGPFQRLAAFYTTVLQGDPKPGGVFGKGLLQHQAQRTVHEGGRTWIEFEWTLASSPQQPTVMRVDPETKLPVFLLSPRGGNQSMRYDFDFPNAGPADIYALGVPRNARIEDRLPSPEGKRAVEAGQAGRKDLDNYFAIVYGTESPPGDPHKISSVHLVWRKGDAWRLEYCKSRSGRLPKLPATGADLSWWKTQLANFICVPDLVCDGRQILSGETGKLFHLVGPREDHAEIARQYGQGKMIEVEAYPQIAPTGRFVPDSGSKKMLFEADGPIALATKVWLDPTHGFAAVRYRNDFVDAPFEVARVYEFSGFRQTPRGVWYPSTRRAKSLPKPGTRQIADEVNHFVIDFAAELPESLFTPSVRQ